MRTAVFLLIVWSAAAGAADRGADGSSPAPGEVKARTEVSAPSESTAPNQAPASSAGPPAGDAAEFKPPAGYTTKTRGDKTFYCRRETPIGTRFATETCYTQDQLQRIMRSGQSMRDDVARRQKTCSGSACMGG